MSVLEYKGAAAASAVIMSHKMRRCKILFVEGNHDGRLFNSLYGEAFIPIAAKGMKGVIEALDVIDEHNKKPEVSKRIDVLGFIDQDYLSLSDVEGVLSRKDIFTSNFRDIEIDLFNTQGLKRLLEEKASPGKWSCEKKLLGDVLDCVRRLSHLRAYNAYHQKNWDFKIIDLCKYVNTSGKLNSNKMESAFRQKNGINAGEWSEFEDWESTSGLKLNSITRGHDVACVIGQMLRKKIGNRKHEKMHGEIIEEDLRLAIEQKFVQIYEWFEKLYAWAYNNHIQPTLVTSRT